MFKQSLNLTICLPPKCGTTNWQYALSTLNKDGPHGRGFIPSLGTVQQFCTAENPKFLNF